MNSKKLTSQSVNVSNILDKTNIVRRHWSIQNMLYILLALALLGLSISYFLGYRTLNLVKVNGPIYQNIIQGKDLIGDILPPPAYLLETYITVQEMSMETDADKITDLVNEFKKQKTNFLSRHNFWASTLVAGEVKEAMVGKASETGKVFLKVVEDEFIPLVKAGKMAEAKEMISTRLKDLFAEHKNAINIIVGMASERVSDDEKNAAKVLHKQWIILGSIASILFIALIFGNILISKQILAQLNEVTKVIGTMSEGDLTCRLQISPNTEVGIIGIALNQSLEKISNVIRSIRENARSLGNASQQLHGDSNAMGIATKETSTQAGMASDGANIISNNAQTVASGMEEMGASIREIANNTSNAARVAEEAVKLVDNASISVNKLGDTGERIGDIIKVITSIAGQTNLLALNATIEAARAGGAGKGFAVVAGEVKELAKETAHASIQIIQQINTIQEETSGAVKIMKEINATVIKIKEIQLTIAGAVEEQSMTTAEIGKNITKVANSSTEIAQNISIVAMAVEGTTTGAENVRKASSVLAEMSTSLNKLLAEFKC